METTEAALISGIESFSAENSMSLWTTVFHKFEWGSVIQLLCCSDGIWMT